MSEEVELSRSFTALLLGAALLAAPLAAVAQGSDPEAAASPGRAADAPKAKGLDPNRRVCKGIAATGSRLDKVKVCKTAREWDEQKRVDRAELNRMQTQLPTKAPGT